MLTFRIEQLAAEAGLTVSNVRSYQTSKLISSPKRTGRKAIYDSTHLTQLKEIRRLRKLGYSLSQIKAIFLGRGDPILDKLVSTAPLSKKALAEKAGVSLAMLNTSIQAGLLKPAYGSSNRYYTDAVEMLQAAADLVAAGVDEMSLLMLANTHDIHIKRTADRAVKIFAKSIKENTDAKTLSREELSSEIQALLDSAVKLVASHFRQTLLAKVAEFVKK